MANLMETLQGYLTPELLQKAGALTGESQTGVQTTLTGIFPTILGGLLSRFSSSAGLSQLQSLAQQAAGSGILNHPAEAFGGGDATAQAAGKGQDLLKEIFGGKLDAVTGMIAAHGGIAGSSASSLLGLAAPLVMGTVGKAQAAQGLSAAGLGSMLLGQKDAIAKLAPAGLAGALGAGSLGSLGSGLTGALTAAAGGIQRKGTPRWVAPLVALIVLIIIIAYFAGRKHSATALIHLPDGSTVTLPTNSLNYNLASFLADTANTAVPRTFVFEHLNFQTGTATLMPGSDSTVRDLATILKAYPRTQVTLDGYTDNAGNADANQQLSQARAEAVKAMLVEEGIGQDRLTAQGFGEARPVASNATDEGRAKNRRTELTITQK